MIDNCDHIESNDTNTNFKSYKNDQLNPSFSNIFDGIKTARIINEIQMRNASVAFGLSLEKKIPILIDGDPLINKGNVLEYKADYSVIIDDDTGYMITVFHNGLNAITTVVYLNLQPQIKI